jgi:hypothetical protein
MQINGEKNFKLLRVAAESSHVFCMLFVLYTLALIAVVIAMCLLVMQNAQKTVLDPIAICWGGGGGGGACNGHR